MLRDAFVPFPLLLFMNAQDYINYIRPTPISLQRKKLIVSNVHWNTPLFEFASSAPYMTGWLGISSDCCGHVGNAHVSKCYVTFIHPCIDVC